MTDMAKMSVIGLDEIEGKLRSIEQGLRGEAEDRILRAGAEVLAGGWQESILNHGHRVTGGMYDSVAATDIRHNGNGAEIAVYPQGTDKKHRINQAQKAYILHHGRAPTKRGTKAIKGDNFVTEAERSSNQKVHEAMQRALDDYIAGKE